MKLSLKAGTTSKTINIFVQDASSSSGAGLTGLAYDTSGLEAYYALPRAAATAITLATLAAVTSAYSSGGFKEVSAAHMPGVYRFDIPDAALASGSFVTLYLQGAANMVPLPIEIELTAVDNQDATAFGVSRLDAAVTSRMATFTLPTNFSSLAIDGSGRVDLSKWKGSTPSDLISGRVDANAQVVGDKTGYSISGTKTTLDALNDITAASVWSSGSRTLTSFGTLVQDIWNKATSALTTAGSIGKLLVDRIDATISSRSVAGAAMTLTSGERNAVADAYLDRANAIETGLTPRQQMRLSAACDAGKLSGAAGTTVVIRNAVADTKDRITATVTADGNRTAVSLDLT